MSRSEQVMSTAHRPMYEWRDLPWQQIERQVFKLQKRIYQAARCGNVKAVHHLQKLLIKSWFAKCLAVRRVTQDNQGKRSAGIDGVKSLTPKERLELVNRLQPQLKPQPVRRIWIPKPGTTEKRPLGIPTIQDRALQALAKLALEPEWEAKFEPNSYGFRPGRSCHDAIEAIYLGINKQPKYVLDADIAKCFDHISHPALLTKLKTYPTLRRLVKSWLRAGVMDGPTLFPSTEGVPQGGILSPLLANIALHGLEKEIVEAYSTTHRHNGKRELWRPILIRYADDLVILHRDLAVIQDIKDRTSRWLADMGLEFKPSKTRITHTLTPHEGPVGFDFLGFHIRQYPMGKTHSGKRTRGGGLLGFKTLIRPSQETMHRHGQALAETIKRLRTAPQAALIAQLNPIIKGWSNYYSAVAAKRTFSRMDHLLYQKLRRWANRRHPNLGKKKVAAKYWRLETGHWRFGTKEGVNLQPHAKTPIRRHAKVLGTKSLYDGDWVYWATRMGRHPELPKQIAILLKRQTGKCVWCGLYFKPGDLLEVDHIVPTACNGPDTYQNRQLLHRHCHDCKSIADQSTINGTHDQSHSAEEPDEPNGSRPVLKTNQSGN